MLVGLNAVAQVWEESGANAITAGKSGNLNNETGFDS